MIGTLKREWNEKFLLWCWSDDVNFRCSFEAWPHTWDCFVVVFFFLFGSRTEQSRRLFEDLSLLCRVQAPIYTQRHAHVHTLVQHTHRTHAAAQSSGALAPFSPSVCVLFILGCISLLFFLFTEAKQYLLIWRFSGSIYITDVSSLQTLCNWFMCRSCCIGEHQLWISEFMTMFSLVFVVVVLVVVVGFFFLLLLHKLCKRLLNVNFSTLENWEEESHEAHSEKRHSHVHTSSSSLCCNVNYCNTAACICVMSKGSVHSNYNQKEKKEKMGQNFARASSGHADSFGCITYKLFVQTWDSSPSAEEKTCVCVAHLTEKCGDYHKNIIICSNLEHF